MPLRPKAKCGSLNRYMSDDLLSVGGHADPPTKNLYQLLEPSYWAPRPIVTRDALFFATARTRRTFAPPRRILPRIEKLALARR